MAEQLFNRKEVEKILDNYPTLEVILLGGTVNKKWCREMLNIDKWLMDDLFKSLLLAGAIKSNSSSLFRAKDDLIILIKERRESR